MATTLNFILGVLTLILGGTNIATLAQLRSLRKKGNFEAESVQITNLQQVIHLQGEEVRRLADRLEAQEQKTDECGARCEERIASLQSNYEGLITALRGANVKGLNL